MTLFTNTKWSSAELEKMPVAELKKIARDLRVGTGTWRRDAKKDALIGGVCAAQNGANGYTTGGVRIEIGTIEFDPADDDNDPNPEPPTGAEPVIAPTKRSTDDLFDGFAEAIAERMTLKAETDEAKIEEIAKRVFAESNTPRTLEIIRPDVSRENIGLAHRQFDEIMGIVAEGHKNILMVGPAGTGKTTIAAQVAKALDRQFDFLPLSLGVTETHIYGRQLPQEDGSWKYRESPFVRIYRTGGVFLLDEFDAADANVMVSINAALANGKLSNPISGTTIDRHPDCIIIAAANTYGKGGDMMYAGRNQLDAATLDRFTLASAFIDYDTTLERAIVDGLVTTKHGDTIMDWIKNLRRKIAEARLRRVASTRTVERAAMVIKTGKTMDDVRTRFFQDWTPDERAKVGATL